MSEEQVAVSGLADYKYGFSYPDQSVFKPDKGLSEEVVRAISGQKHEPEWMLEFRLRALKAFYRKSMPNWGGDISSIDFEDIYYYAKPSQGQVSSWKDLPEDIRREKSVDYGVVYVYRKNELNGLNLFIPDAVEGIG